MDSWSVSQVMFVAAVVVVTAVALYTDLRWARIPNALTLPFFALGWIYRVWAYWDTLGPGLIDALQGFALGFGTYFVLWIVAGSGGGDVKLMGALSVWLGFKLTLWVIVVSTVLVAIDLMFVTLYRIARFGVGSLRRQDSSDRNADAKEHRGGAAADQRRRLRFAVPLALATWLVLLADATLLRGGVLAP
jgi:prepilin peptidase CpaA